MIQSFWHHYSLCVVHSLTYIYLQPLRFPFSQQWHLTGLAEVKEYRTIRFTYQSHYQNQQKMKQICHIQEGLQHFCTSYSLLSSTQLLLLLPAFVYQIYTSQTLPDLPQRKPAWYTGFHHLFPLPSLQVAFYL